ncbi:MAG: PA3496 family putative envelope integrity protein [Gammaproteobacteria bacterium]
MAKNQSKPEDEEADPWLGDEAPDFGDAIVEPVTPPRSKLETRLKIEDLIEQRRLKQMLGDYDSFEFEDERPRRLH